MVDNQVDTKSIQDTTTNDQDREKAASGTATHYLPACFLS